MEMRGQYLGRGSCCHSIDKAGARVRSEAAESEGRKQVQSSSEEETTHRGSRGGEANVIQGNSRGQVGQHGSHSPGQGKQRRSGEFFKEVEWEEYEFEFRHAEFEC